MRMPFGKHKGECLTAVPLDYLHWLHQECDLRKPLKVAVAAELERRGWNQSPEPVPAKPTGLTTDLVGAWYRKVAVEFHPDRRGGNHEGMKAINRAREVLLGLLEAYA